MHGLSKFINGVATNAAHPDTFYIPEAPIREGLEPGAVVKIGLTFVPQGLSCSGERFWVVITRRTVDSCGSVHYCGRIVNDLVCEEHGFDRDDLIAFTSQHVLDVHEEPAPSSVVPFQKQAVS